jgi:flagellar FliJ protein
MKRDQLGLLRQLAERQERDASSRLAKAQESVSAAQQQLRQVLSYRNDYHRLAVGGGSDSVDTYQLQAARNFLSELDAIAGRQRASVQQAELLLDQHRVGWAEAKRRLQAIEKLQKARSKLKARAEEKLSQRLIDELFSIQRAFAEAR